MAKAESKEIEAKILQVNEKEIIAKLESLGAKKEHDGGVVSIYLDTPDFGLEREGKVLRLRKMNAKTYLTFKGKPTKNMAKVCDEYETLVGDFDSMRSILSGLGYRETKRSDKHRTSYSLNGVLFELDTYSGIPTFLEIEAPSVKELEKAFLLLGFSMKDAKPWTLKDVLEHYKTE